jgi:histone-lysine N-methyltransferase SETMAR
MVEFIQQGTTIMSELYCETLKKMRRAMGMLTYDVVLLHINARPHKAPRTPALLEHFNWELSHHPPYSPDLAPSDCRLFNYLTNWFGSQRFNNNEKLMEGV